MKKVNRFLLGILFLLSLGCISYANAQNAPLAPSGTFTLEVKALTLYDGESALPVSKGVLTFQGKQYPFTIQALSMGNHFGESTLKASGVLYGMKDLSQFESPFHVIGGGISPNMADQVVTFKNEKGVVSVLHGQLTGPLFVPSTGAIVKFLK